VGAIERTKERKTGKKRWREGGWGGGGGKEKVNVRMCPIMNTALVGASPGS
jgi:hypothetical protein